MVGSKKQKCEEYEIGKGKVVRRAAVGVIMSSARRWADHVVFKFLSFLEFVQPPNTPAKYCDECGAQYLRETSKFCSECGAKRLGT